MKKRKLRPSIEIALYVIALTCIVIGSGVTNETLVEGLILCLIALVCIVPIVKWGHR